MWNTSRHTRQIKILLATFLLCLATNANAVRDGETVYQSECVHCHASGVERMPTLQTLKGMQTEAIIQSLGSGSMRIIGTFELNGPERIAVAEYITGKTYDPNWNIQSQNLCSHDNWDTASIASLLIKPH